MSFGNRLASLRKTDNLTRKDLAKILNISYSALSNYETNERFPDQKMLIKISDFFDVSIDYLLGRSNMKKFAPDPNIYSKEELEEFASRFTNNNRINLFSNPILCRIQELSKESKKDLLEYLELLELRDMQKKKSSQ